MKAVLALSVTTLIWSLLPSMAWGQYPPNAYHPNYAPAVAIPYYGWGIPGMTAAHPYAVQPVQAVNPVPVSVQSVPPQSNAVVPVATPPAGACRTCVNCCDAPCIDCCDAPCPKNWRCAGGGSWYYLKPHWDTNPAFFIDGDFATEVVDEFGIQQDIEWTYQSAYSIWLAAIAPGGLGGRIRFFSFDQTSDTLTAVQFDDEFNIDSASGGPNVRILLMNAGDVLVVDSGLEIYVGDIEAIYAFGRGPWSAVLFGGARIAEVTQNYTAFGQSPGTFDSILDFNHGFRGAGPTFGLELRRLIANSGIGIYCSVRAAFLVGEGHYSATQFEEGFPGVGSIDTAGINNWDDVLSVVELELGIEWSRCCGSCEFYANVGVVSYNWLGVGNATLNSLLIGTSRNFESNTNMTLFGGTVGGGIRF